MSEITVRKAVLTDLDTIVEYNRALARETEDRQLDVEILTPGVRRLLNDSSKGEYFVAESEGAVVGQIMYTREWSDWRNGDLLWLQSVYVHKDHRGLGVFARLLGALKAIVESHDDVVGLRLYVEHENVTAQNVYKKNSFTDTGYRVMEWLSKVV